MLSHHSTAKTLLGSRRHWEVLLIFKKKIIDNCFYVGQSIEFSIDFKDPL